MRCLSLSYPLLNTAKLQNKKKNIVLKYLTFKSETELYINFQNNYFLKIRIIDTCIYEGLATAESFYQDNYALAHCNLRH